MKVLIACEESQVVLKEFRKKGHEAYSCDIQPCSGGYPEFHIQDDVFNHINSGWDMMISHPPCTYLSVVGNAWFNEDRYGEKARMRKILRKEAFDFVIKLSKAPIDKIAIENPVGWLNSNWRKPDQIIEPFHFGDYHRKRTCLWLKNLFILSPTKFVEPKIIGIRRNKNNKLVPLYFVDIDRDPKRRSKTFVGIAKAMASQWGSGRDPRLSFLTLK